LVKECLYHTVPVFIAGGKGELSVGKVHPFSPSFLLARFDLKGVVEQRRTMQPFPSLSNAIRVIGDYTYHPPVMAIFFQLIISPAEFPLFTSRENMMLETEMGVMIQDSVFHPRSHQLM
jgi:hypothetical protein